MAKTPGDFDEESRQLHRKMREIERDLQMIWLRWQQRAKLASLAGVFIVIIAVIMKGLGFIQ